MDKKPSSSDSAEAFLDLLPSDEPSAPRPKTVWQPPPRVPGSSQKTGFVRVSDALRWGEETLTAEGIAGARLQATVLLGDCLGLNRAQVLAHLLEPVDEEEAGCFRDLVGQRAAHVPLQYLRGKAPFLDFDVEVEPGVFIPRPETELVIEQALAIWRPAPASAWVVDVGTGSGVIAIAIARARPVARVVAIDCSDQALAMARHNARTLGVEEHIEFLRGDLLAPLGAGEGEPSPEVRESVSMVISNPPYAPEDGQVDPEVRDHEPRLAWEAGPTGLEVYERLIPQAANLLLPGRPLVLELGYGQGGPVSYLLAADGRWHEPAVLPDFQGIPRILTAFRA